MTYLPLAPPVSGTVSDLLRPHLHDAVEEIEHQVRIHVLGTGQPLDGDYEHMVHTVISETVAHFVDSLGRDEFRGREPRAAELRALYTRLGAEAAIRGRSADLLQSALRLSGQIVCRRFIKDAYRFSWPRETLATLTDNLFELLGRAADAGAQGYARQQGLMASDRAHHRTRLRDLLLREPPPAPDALAAQAGAAGWAVPHTLTAVALPPAPRAQPSGRVLPPDILPNWDPPGPYLIVPDPDTLGRERLHTLLAPFGSTGIGPTVPPSGAAASLGWARHTLLLVERGILPSGRPVRASDHTALLAAARAEDLIGTTASPFLNPLLALPPARRAPLLATLLTYLESGDNAVTTGRRLRVHEQTVRYRLRRITELTGHLFDDPAQRLDLMLTLTWLVHVPPAPRTGNAGRVARGDTAPRTPGR
ncbi:PucR family transcriptional regulator [Streptomyces sp. NPDC050535]|uniref:PucR family transcriptional regulator n=1 Tax=Streptomyces sp. NPDC050535 TaxID=3365626 RepID=UPI0037A22EF1